MVVVGAQVGVGIGNIEAMATVKVARQRRGRVEGCIVNAREEVQVVEVGVVSGVVVDGVGIILAVRVRPTATGGPGSHFRP